MVESSPTVWRRWLAFELRRFREERNLAQKEAGKACGWSGARLSYIENALQNVVEQDLDKLLSLYEVPENRWGGYYEAVERSQEKGWWERYQRVVPDWLSLFVGLEQGAAAIRSFELVVIPGLLQTHRYAAAVLKKDVWPFTDDRIERLVEVRMARQGILAREPDPLNLSVVLDEAILRHAADPRIMAEQLDHLITMAERSNITLRVLPYRHGVHSYAPGAFQILEFPWDTDPGVVYIEHRDGAVYLEEVHEIDSYTLAFERLSDLAMTPDESIATMRAIAEEYAP